jgi:peptidoglycan hydrolase-like protein with peptidoglycan-binding domain
MSTAKKVAVVALAFVMVFGSVGFAKAVTTTDLQAQIAALLAQINALQAQLSAQGGAATSSYTYTKDLTLGSKGDDVTALQQMLISGGFLTAVSAPTGYFGPLTKSALAAYQASVGISPAAGYFGPKTRAYVASLPAAGGGAAAGGGTSTTTPTVSGAPLTVTLASDSPVGGNILAGSANNVVSKLVFTAGNDADAKITGLTVKSFGTAALGAADIANVKIFDGSTQIGLTQTQIQGISTFTFAPSITITKGTSKVLSVVVDVAATPGATPSATIKMGIETAAKILGGTAFTGTFPIVGNSNVIVAGGSIGTLTVTPGAPVAVNNSYVGATNVVLGNFIVTSGTNEDVKVTQFRVSYGAGLFTGATIQDSDITNLRVQVDGVNVGSPANFSTRRASIDLTTPIILTKGSSKIFTVIGDIASGALRVSELDNAVNSINGVGVTSGVGVTGGGPLAPLGAINRVTIGQGVLAISVSTSSPAGANAIVVRSITPQVLGVFDVRAVGEDILVNTVNMTVGGQAGAAGSITNVGLYDEVGALLSNQQTLPALSWTAPPVIQQFALNWLIPANTTKKLYVKGTTNTITAPNPASVVVTLAINPASSVIATGMSSSGITGPNNVLSASALALPALSINATASYLAVPDPTTSVYNQAVISPAAQVTLGYLKVTAQNEDQTLNSMEITNTGVGNMSAILSGVALFDGTTQITTFNAPNNGVATCLTGAANPNRVCFQNADVLTPTTFLLNTPKVLKVMGNVLALAPVEVDRLQLQVALNNLRTLGKSSGVFALNTGAGGVVGAIALTTNVGAYNETGLFDVRTNVVEVTKDAASPSGNVRGTFVNHGIWDFTLNGTAANADVGAITFTSQVGVPNVGAAPLTPAMFRLYDYTNSAALNVPAAVNIGAGTVTFANIPAGTITLTRGQVRKLSLQVTTTNVAAWPINTALQWSIRSFGSVQIGSMGTAVGAGTDLASAGAITQTYVGGNVVGMLVAVPGGVAFNPALHRLYYNLAGTGVVAIGDTLLWADPASVFAPGSIVAAGNADIAAGAGVLAVDALTTTNAVGVAFVPGIDSVWTGAAPVAAGSVRLVGGIGPPDGFTQIEGAGALPGKLLTTSAAAAFNPALHRLYWSPVGGAGNVVAIGDTLLWANPGWAFGPGSVVAAGNTDIGLWTRVLAADALTTTNAANTAFVPGVDSIWTGAAPVNAGDVLLVRGNTTGASNWAGEVGYGGTTWSYPADANSVTLP